MSFKRLTFSAIIKAALFIAMIGLAFWAGFKMITS